MRKRGRSEPIVFFRPAPLREERVAQAAATFSRSSRLDIAPDAYPSSALVSQSVDPLSGSSPLNLQFAPSPPTSRAVGQPSTRPVTRFMSSLLQ
uniref:Uncharacterized protein n=1 Tax=Plectus sambesii TaxID=2011161 RepID=A0A914UHM4_9BILA